MSKMIRAICTMLVLAALTGIAPAAAEETLSGDTAELQEQVSETAPVETAPVETAPTFTLPRDKSSETADGILFITDPSTGEVTVTGYTGYEKSLNIPSTILGGGVTEIAAEAFAQNGTVERIVLPDSVVTLGVSAFEGCVRLKNITLPANITAIPARAFRNCSRLAVIELPVNIESIGEFAFENCSRLGKLEIPETVTEIGPDAFMGCSRLYLITGSNALVREYAAAYSISTSFTDTFEYRIVIIICITLVFSAALLFVRRYYLKYIKKEKR